MVYIEHAQCVTALGDAPSTLTALNQGQVGLQRTPVPEVEGEPQLPLAYIESDASVDQPTWMPYLMRMASGLPDKPWGTAKYPVFLTSSNYGIDQLYAFSQSRDSKHLQFATPQSVVLELRNSLGWGRVITILSHACVTGQLGLLLAERAIEQSGAEAALVLSYDFLSPFVVGGFYSLKILNEEMPQPFSDREVGSIGLGEGCAAVVLSPNKSSYRVGGQTLYNEMYHFTSNAPDGSGFERILKDAESQLGGARCWVKGHGTGTLEAGRLESRGVAAKFSESPLVSWKGSLGHTLGSCAVVELCIAMAAMEEGRAPGTVGAKAPFFTDSVQADSFNLDPYDGALLLSNAFGGAHAAMSLFHE